MAVGKTKEGSELPAKLRERLRGKREMSIRAATWLRDARAHPIFVNPVPLSRTMTFDRLMVGGPA